ncbi:unnamed protein product, partial [Discosporangium mesarthrocarpum]
MNAYEENLTAWARSQAIQCTVCHRDLSLGIYPVKEHPVVPGVAICAGSADEEGKIMQRCHEHVLSELEEPQEEAAKEDDVDVCAWCAGREDKRLLLCDNDGCNRSFCADCIETNLGSELLETLERTSDPWDCLVCDDKPLDPLQEELWRYEKDPPLLLKILSRLAEEAAAI